jgi:hypothetical protein
MRKPGLGIGALREQKRRLHLPVQEGAYHAAEQCDSSNLPQAARDKQDADNPRRDHRGYRKRPGCRKHERQSEIDVLTTEPLEVCRWNSGGRENATDKDCGDVKESSACTATGDSNERI